jgi:hypothetical protein
VKWFSLVVALVTAVAFWISFFNVLDWMFVQSWYETYKEPISGSALMLAAFVINQEAIKSLRSKKDNPTIS